MSTHGCIVEGYIDIVSENSFSCIVSNFLCPQRNFGRQIVMALSIRLSRFESSAYLLHSLR